MSFTTTQKIIKIGTSRGVTIPAKILREMDISDADEIEVEFKAVHKKSDRLDTEYEKFKKQYGETLKNLADR